jgi:PHD/YefM family antitoxin component YafN of YafNO toxin-antitoxin module
LSEAGKNLPALLDEAAEQEVYLMRYSRPVGVLLDAAKYERLLDYVEDLEDRSAASDAAASGEYVPFDPAEFGVEPKEPAAEIRGSDGGRRSVQPRRAKV